MTSSVQFGIARSLSYPTGTGSYGYDGSFKILVQNLAYEKQVSIWCRTGSIWKDIPARYVASLPGNLELWAAAATNSEDEFDAKYTVLGTTWWDNNLGRNYKFPKAYDEFSVLSGISYPVILGSASLSSPVLHVNVGVQNLAYDKTIGIVLTTDGWASWRIAYGEYSWTMPSGLEVWVIDEGVGTSTAVEFAVFGSMADSQYWDNNIWRNYRVTTGRSIQTWDPPQ